MMENDRKKIDEFLSLMREKVNQNIQKVSNNSDLIKNILIEDSMNQDRESKLNTLYEQNKICFEENNELLAIQKKIVDYKIRYLSENKPDKYFDPAESEVVEEITREECFKRTLDGSIKLDDSHPLIKDEVFLNELLIHYEKCEEYEKCSEIFSILKQAKSKNIATCQTINHE